MLGGSGGVGQFLLQLASHEGLRTIAVGGPSSHERMRDDGADGVYRLHDRGRGCSGRSSCRAAGSTPSPTSSAATNSNSFPGCAQAEGVGRLDRHAGPRSGCRARQQHRLPRRVDRRRRDANPDTWPTCSGGVSCVPTSVTYCPSKKRQQAHRILESGHAGGKVVLYGSASRSRPFGGRQPRGESLAESWNVASQQGEGSWRSEMANRTSERRGGGSPSEQPLVTATAWPAERPRLRTRAISTAKWQGPSVLPSRPLGLAISLWSSPVWVGCDRSTPIQRPDRPGDTLTPAGPSRIWSGEERKNALAEAVALELVDGCRVEPVSDYQVVLVKGSRPNHGLHL